jgi:hypothetical protein
MGLHGSPILKEVSVYIVELDGLSKGLSWVEPNVQIDKLNQVV